MTAIISRIQRSCLALCALLLSSCFDVREEFWLHEDGSAEAEISCELPRSATLAMGREEGVKALADRILSQERDIDAYEVKVSSHEDRTTLRIHVKVNQLMNLGRLQRAIARHKELPGAVRKMVGEFDVGMKGLASVSIKRTVTPGEAAPALGWLPKGQLRDYKLLQIIHLPNPVKQHNAHETWDGGRTLAWETPLAEAVNMPIVYEFTMPIPLPWGWLTAGALSLALPVTLLGRFLLRRRSGRLPAKDGTASVAGDPI